MVNRRVFVSYSFENRKEFVAFNETLKKFLIKNGFDVYSFVFDFNGEIKNNKDLMDRALKEIDESDIVVAELSYKRVGIGLEVGYAKAKGKKIIYIHRNGSDISTTVDGIANIRLEYKNVDDLLIKLKKCFV